MKNKTDGYGGKHSLMPTTKLEIEPSRKRLQSSAEGLDSSVAGKIESDYVFKDDK